ncbi:MAG: UvrB/UvrC motif-containing protein, partial [Clostridia bacterium]|nr:UvrB/UvrC motif-containing protein [Clostridia bacterium]
IAALEQQMQQAVESQNFEQAAVLRDNIKALREEQ